MCPQEHSKVSAKAGEIARESGEFRCSDCSRSVSVRDGYPIPDCPQCGSASFHTGSRTLQNRIADQGYAIAANM
jgi:Zn finger protein HypA/HybF involved in hydrogenase expression